MHYTSRGSLRRSFLAAVVLTVLTVAIAAGSAAVAAFAQDSKSAPAARALAEALDAAKLDAIAAPDPAAPGTWVAALYFKDSQLLVVSAQYSAPTLLDAKLRAKEYRDIYIDLNSASVAGTKVFVMDQNADGLVAKPENEGSADSWDEKNKAVAFDGEWKKAKMSEADYMKTFNDADERYSRMVALLAAQVKGKIGS